MPTTWTSDVSELRTSKCPSCLGECPWNGLVSSNRRTQRQLWTSECVGTMFGDTNIRILSSDPLLAYACAGHDDVANKKGKRPFVVLFCVVVKINRKTKCGWIFLHNLCAQSERLTTDCWSNSSHCWPQEADFTSKTACFFQLIWPRIKSQMNASEGALKPTVNSWVTQLVSELAAELATELASELTTELTATEWKP